MPLILLNGLTSVRSFRDQIHVCLSCDEARNTPADEGMIVDR
jgi:hypothetical protein